MLRFIYFIFDFHVCSASAKIHLILIKIVMEYIDFIMYFWFFCFPYFCQTTFASYWTYNGIFCIYCHVIIQAMPIISSFILIKLTWDILFIQIIKVLFLVASVSMHFILTKLIQILLHCIHVQFHLKLMISQYWFDLCVFDVFCNKAVS